jgi:ATP-dependent helicase/nuclease subunit A
MGREGAMTEPDIAPVKFAPPDHAERSRALDPARSFLVQAPAGSGKTYLLTQRFLRLLALAAKPDEIVAITFTNAAAAEMRNRVLEALENAETSISAEDADPESLPALAQKAMEHAHQMGWKILDQPGQLRITTIDAFCRGLALQSPLSWGLLSGLGGRLDAVENASDLYRRAARRTLELLAGADSPLRRSVEEVLLWRDNNWKDVEDLLVDMLGQRNRWYQEFVFAREGDWEALRRRLEAPFCRGVRRRLEVLGRMLDGLSGSREFAMELAQFACTSGGKLMPTGLAERAELPVSFVTIDGVEEAVLLDDAAGAYRDLACFLLTAKGEWRKKGGLNVNHGFPATLEGKAAKERFGELIDGLRQEPGLEAALAAFCAPMPVRYTEEEWTLMRHCFAVLRVAFVELQGVFAETGSVDFVEVAQIALRILEPQNGFPSDLTIRQADSIRHLLIDEFQDTSRSQHQLLARLIAAWPEREGRSCFCVGDPMQSIYGFREAEVELFERTRTHGLEISDGVDETPFRFEFVSLRANFRTAPSLVEDLNGHFERIFSEDDGSGVRFFPVEAARAAGASSKTELHLAFTRSTRATAANSASFGEPEKTRREQLNEIVGLIRGKLPMIAEAQKGREADKFRVAVLGRTKKSLVLIAEALREAGIGFRAIELVKLRERPEVLDALSLVRAVLNPVDRTAWLGVLRAPWCGLSLEELHLLTSADDELVGDTPIPILLEARLNALHEQGRIAPRALGAASRVGRVLRSVVETRAAAAGSALGTWVESIWKALGGEATVDAEQRQNLRLLWSALDALPEGELDLVGPGLGAALDALYALPDPSSSGDFGVQLMTIHKSKGLEFEVVIVPDLEAEGRKGERTMISWLERGLADSGEDGDGQLTEFLIAPIQSKGEDPGVAKSWVDAVKRERERQELRRVLYVAATRARDELHLFARPRFSVSKLEGEFTLAKPAGLLATAWPALGDAVESQFSAWTAGLEARLEGMQQSSAGDQIVETLAAQAGNVVEMPAPVRPARLPTRLRRLPEAFAAPAFPRRSASPSGNESSGILAGEDPLYARTEGGLRSRLEGTAVHKFLEQLSRLRQSMDHDDAARAIEEALPGIVAEIRSRGLPLLAAQKLAREALAAARRTLADPVGAWILTPHPEAGAELRWTGMVRMGKSGPDVAGTAEERLQQRNLRPDRVFFALSADEPEGLGRAMWWIIDYKTSHASGANLSGEAERRAFLEAHREQHEGQLATYAQMLRSLRGSGVPVSELEIHAGIYYPRLQLFDFWKA